MSLQLFADHCVPTILIKGLADHGLSIFILRDHLPVYAPDSVVIEKAQELDSILLSLNGDFSDIIRFPPAKFKGIISLKVMDQPRHFPFFLNLLKDFFDKHRIWVITLASYLFSNCIEFEFGTKTGRFWEIRQQIITNGDKLRNHISAAIQDLSSDVQCRLDKENAGVWLCRTPRFYCAIH